MKNFKWIAILMWISGGVAQADYVALVSQCTPNEPDEERLGFDVYFNVTAKKDGYVVVKTNWTLSEQLLPSFVTPAKIEIVDDQLKVETTEFQNSEKLAPFLLPQGTQSIPAEKLMKGFHGAIWTCKTDFAYLDEHN